jgi:hypothetical protein
MGDMILELAKEILEQPNDYVRALRLAGKIRAITTGASCDSYSGEKVSLGFTDMMWHAKAFLNEVKKNPDEEKRTHLTYEQAVEMLEDGEEIHTFRNSPMMLIGADWSRKHLLETMKKYESTLELTGPAATGMGHGLALHDDMGPLFIKTKHEQK